MSQDVVLITVDALRHDVTDRLTATRQYFSDEEQRKVTTSGAATNWVFPGILSGTYYPDAYDEEGLVRDDLTALPDRLDEMGYETGGFVSFNPYVNKWNDRFDTFWNGGMKNADEEWYSSQIEKWVSRAYRTALLKKRVPGSETVRRAQEWYNSRSSPRFLWVHLMEPHGPYYPGFSAARDIGVLDTYRSILNFQRLGDDAPNRDIEIQRRLYNRCVERADQRVGEILSFVSDDAATVVVGDHGEEFNHGHIDHERLYDECVRTPFLYRNIEVPSPSGQLRQIEIPTEILKTVGTPVPDSWDAEEFDTETPAFMLTPWSANGTFQFAIRTDSEKLIRTYDSDSGEIQRHEYYDIESDPDEVDDKYITADTEKSEVKLDEFVELYDHVLDIDPNTGSSSDVVEERLRNLGYK